MMPKLKGKKRGARLSPGPKAPEVLVPVVRAHQSPLNEKQWLVTLECGHERWITSDGQPKMVHCHACEPGARKSDSWGWAGGQGKGNRRSPKPGPKAPGMGSDDGGPGK